MRIAFIAHMSAQHAATSAASSAAGNQVQRQILLELERARPTNDVRCYAMHPHPSWPRGPLFSKSYRHDNLKFIGYINVPVLKHIIFSIRMLFNILSWKPNSCIQYNSYLFENVFLLIYKIIEPSTSNAIIIQDVYTVSSSKSAIRWKFRIFFEKFSMKLSGNFNIIIPISQKIIEDFDLPEQKCIIFQGGVTEFSLDLMKSEKNLNVEDFAMFAGSLEPYNGAGVLVETWKNLKLEIPLHIFGSGSLSEKIKNASLENRNIIFHGQTEQSCILEYQRRSRWNICLRYSLEIDQKYFFPSKFFNNLAAPGYPICNDFYGIPNDRREHLHTVADDLSDLHAVLQKNMHKDPAHEAAFRRKALLHRHTWSAIMDKVMTRLEGRSGSDTLGAGL